MHAVITTTRAAWAVREDAGAPDRHGECAGVQGACVAPSEGAGRGSLEPVDGDSRRSQAHYDRFNRWLGKAFGVRKPGRDETPLSADEIQFAIETGILDALPVRRVFKGVGEWESKPNKLGQKATPFDGLFL